MALTTFPVTYSDGMVLTASALTQNFNALNTATVGVGNGGTGLAAGTSGGIPYFSSASAMGSSGVLTANGVVYGGGAGAAPGVTAAGTASQVLVGGTPPSFGTAPVAGGGTNIASYTAGDTLYASAATVLTKLAKGTGLQVYRMNAGATAPEWGAGVIVYARQASAVSVTNTVSETSVFSQSIAANDLSTNRTLRLHLQASYTNNAGADRSFTFRVKFGGTTFLVLTTTALATNAAARDVALDVYLGNRGATNAQDSHGKMFFSAAGAASTALLEHTNRYSYLTGGTIDTTGAQTFQVTAEHSAADTTITVVSVTLELL